MTIYFESGNQPLIGKVATANVVMNRVHAENYPNDICSVVKQRSQFSYFWDGKVERVPSDNKLEVQAWEESYFLASAFLAEGGDGSQFVDLTEGSLHYAEKSVKKKWMIGMIGKQIGDHVFYRREK